MSDENTNPQDQPGNGTVNAENHMVPKARLDQEIAKRKESDQTLNEIADGFVADIPDDMRELIPDLPPAKKIAWIRQATKKGLFNPPQAPNGPDPKRPGTKQAVNFDGLTPSEKIKAGLKPNK